MRSLTGLSDERQPCRYLVLSRLLEYLGVREESITPWTINHHYRDGRDFPGHRYSKLFISTPCKKRAAGLLKLSRHQLKMAVAILTGHAAVRKHLRTVGLFEGNSTCRLCRKEVETVHHIICCCEALACQRCHVFVSLVVEPTAIRTTSASSY
jgi:hypothetical protein